MGLFCCVVAEFSYWQYFGTYIWFVIIGLRPLGQFLCAIVEEQLQEALLVMPVLTRCFSRTVSQLQVRVDGVLAIIRGSTRLTLSTHAGPYRGLVTYLSTR